MIPGWSYTCIGSLCVSISPVVLVGVSFDVSDNWLDVINSTTLNASIQKRIGIDVVAAEKRVSMYNLRSPQKDAGNLQARIQKDF